MSSYLKRLQKHLMKFMYGSKTCVTIEYMGKEINEGGLEIKKKQERNLEYIIYKKRLQNYCSINMWNCQTTKNKNEHGIRAIKIKFIRNNVDNFSRLFIFLKT